ncbi:MAG: 3-keto-5-aminohexanoate cleavage protein [Candidatus Scalindua sp.]|nr:3-keto-5-aminohexanoate cleavage protein [Candidatus Scalindua sp.]
MLSDKLVINVALTGNVPSKDQTPYVPVTPQEIADDAERVCNLGASILHIHARDKDGNSTYKKEIYKEIIERIRERCGDVIIAVSTSGRRTKDLKHRMEVLELRGHFKPDMASLTLGSMNFLNDYSLNPTEVIIELIETMRNAEIRPELEIFDSGMINYAKFLLKKGRLEGIYYANLILGSLGTMPATPMNLVHLVDELSDNLLWAATGVGQFSLDMQCLSIAIGGNVRVGIEDSIYMDNEKTELATNEKLVLRVRRIAEAMGRVIATPNEVRKILGL